MRDEGRNVSLCSERLTELLGIEGERFSFSLNTVGGTSRYDGMQVDLTVKSAQGEGKVHFPRVWTVQMLPISTSVLPNERDVKK